MKRVFPLVQVYDPRLRFSEGDIRRRQEKNPDRRASRPMAGSQRA
jgi:hypothetical protein